MSKIQSAQTVTTPIASGIADLRRELDEANQERVQVEPSFHVDWTTISYSWSSFSLQEILVSWRKGLLSWKAVAPL